MTIQVKKKVTKKKATEIIASLPDKLKPVDLSKYAGKIKWTGGDPLTLQKQWRDE
ncbi:hypothetical protein [Deminuibacter soli]|uniref:hypothetical protein n=1 Tax=Deminuibacter soli TaxID=2291815 RepID=UPI001314741C|nr:hypothetical protein [Deminuibacter soli]